MLHGWKDNSVLAKPSQHVPIYLQQFPSYSNRKCKKSSFSRTAAHIFVSLETPLRLSRNMLRAVTYYTATKVKYWIKRRTKTLKLPVSPFCCQVSLQLMLSLEFHWLVCEYTKYIYTTDCTDLFTVPIQKKIKYLTLMPQGHNIKQNWSAELSKTPRQHHSLSQMY